MSNEDLDGQEDEEPEEGLTYNQDQHLCRSKCNNKGTTAKYTDYGLMMNARQANGVQSRATIRDSLMFFLAEDLSNTKPIQRQQARVGARGNASPLLHDGRNQEVSGQGQSRSEQGAHTDAQHEIVLPGHKRFADQGREDKSHHITDVPQGEKGPLGKGKNVCQWTKTERGLDML